MRFSIISVAFGSYERFVPKFLEQASKFSDDIIIETERKPMGTMRNIAAAKAKHPYIVSMDIDDFIIDNPDTFGDFVGLNWRELGRDFSFWLPGEPRKKTNTTRSNILISKKLWNQVKFIEHDYYIDELIRQSYLKKIKLNKTRNVCVVHNRVAGSLSENFSMKDKAYREAVAMHKELLRTVG